MMRAGDQVTYTNWLPGRTGNYSGIFDNCVVMVPYKDGVWDDISCGNNVLFGGDSGSMHYTLCKYSKYIGYVVSIHFVKII